MIPAQPILIVALVILVMFYLSRLRSKLLDSVTVLLVFSCALILIIHPAFATRIAALVGVGRGADLVFYVTIPGLAFLILLLFSKLRDLSAKLTETIREQALANTHAHESDTRSAK
jgi:hypothetical protein